jgi:hypothetical protein
MTSFLSQLWPLTTIASGFGKWELVLRYLPFILDDEWISDGQGSVSLVIRKSEAQPSKGHRRKQVISEDVSYFQLSALANK